MIEDPPLLTIRRNFERPPAAAVAALAGTPTGNLVDAMGGRGALDYRIKPLSEDGGMATFSGVAVTCHSGADDNLAIFAAIEVAQPGDVLVVAADGFEGTAVVGDLLTGMAKNRGVAALVIDGLARDIEGIIGVGLPVFSRGITPNSCVRNGPGTVGLAVTAGGVAVNSGDVVVGDRDGAVVVPRDQVAAVVRKLDDVRKAEAGLEAKVKAGLQIPDHVRDLLASDRVRYLD
jgi:4-hydroxy-4-methyl-2-oxoglutarate aldolase